MNMHAKIITVNDKHVYLFDIINTFFWGEKYLNFTKKLY
jgi:hypothetical protein